MQLRGNQFGAGNCYVVLAWVDFILLLISRTSKLGRLLTMWTTPLSPVWAPRIARLLMFGRNSSRVVRLFIPCMIVANPTSVRAIFLSNFNKDTYWGITPWVQAKWGCLRFQYRWLHSSLHYIHGYPSTVCEDWASSRCTSIRHCLSNSLSPPTRKSSAATTASCRWSSNLNFCSFGSWLTSCFPSSCLDPPSQELYQLKWIG